MGSNIEIVAIDGSPLRRLVLDLSKEIVRPRQDSNLRTRLRRPVLYPLSYWGESRGRS